MTSRAIDWKVFLTMTAGLSWVTVSRWSIMLSTAPLISSSMPLIFPEEKVGLSPFLRSLH